MSDLICTRGYITWFHLENGFGFAKPDHGDIDVLIHISVIEFDGEINLEEGQRVYMELEEVKDKPHWNAVKVLPLAKPFSALESL